MGFFGVFLPPFTLRISGVREHSITVMLSCTGTSAASGKLAIKLHLRFCKIKLDLTALAEELVGGLLLLIQKEKQCDAYPLTGEREQEHDCSDHVD